MENFPCALALLFALLLFYFGNERSVLHRSLAERLF